MLPIANHFARQVRSIDPDDVRNRNAARRRNQRRD
jgi:hypothetical protein